MSHGVVVAGREGDHTIGKEVDEDVFILGVNDGGSGSVVHLPLKDGGRPGWKAVVILLVGTDISFAGDGGILLDNGDPDRDELRAGLGTVLDGIGDEAETVDEA